MLLPGAGGGWYLNVDEKYGGIVSGTRVTVLKAILGWIVIYKSDDRRFVLLRIIMVEKGNCHGLVGTLQI